MYILTQNLYFPPVEQADKTGILAIGGDLSIPRLLLAYKSGTYTLVGSPKAHGSGTQIL